MSPKFLISKEEVLEWMGRVSFCTWSNYDLLSHSEHLSPQKFEVRTGRSRNTHLPRTMPGGGNVNRHLPPISLSHPPIRLYVPRLIPLQSKLIQHNITASRNVFSFSRHSLSLCLSASIYLFVLPILPELFCKTCGVTLRSAPAHVSKLRARWRRRSSGAI